MKKNWLRRIIRGVSFTSALFVFQACYGTPQDFQNDVLVEGQVNALASGLPIEGIKVSVADDIQYEMTNEEGKFSFYVERKEDMKIQFQDVDSIQNGLFYDKDTLISASNESVTLNVLLEEK